MEQALIDTMRPASLGDVAEWLRSLGKEFIDNHDRVVAAEELSWRRIGTTVRCRIAQMATEAQTAAAPADAAPATAPAESSAPAPAPDLPRSPRRATSRIAIACGFAATLAVGIALVVRSSSARSAAASPPSPPAEAVTLRIEPAAPAEPAARAEPAAAAAGTAMPTVAAPLAKGAVPDPAPPATPPATAAAPATILRTPPAHPPRPPSGQGTPPRKPPPPPPPPPGGSTTVQHPPVIPAAAAKPDCSTPYYYDGTKKRFKPDCLESDDGKER